MNEIKVNLENLKDNEREQLLALIEKANKKPKRFKPKNGDSYWYMNSFEVVEHTLWNYPQIDLRRYNINNCFETKEEAKFEAGKRKVIAELEIFALENNDEIDWNDRQEKYFLYYNQNIGALRINSCVSYRYQGGICFSSRELCEQAIEKIGADRIKKYLFGVEVK